MKNRNVALGILLLFLVGCVGATTTLTGTSIETDSLTVTTEITAVQPEISRSYISSDQLNLSNNVWTQVLLDVDQYDPSNRFNTTSNTFVCGKSGYYFVSGVCMFSNTVANTNYGVYIRHNGANVVGQGTESMGDSQESVFVKVTTIYHLNVNDEIDLWAVSRSGGDGVYLFNGPGNTYLQLHYISS